MRWIRWRESGPIRRVFRIAVVRERGHTGGANRFVALVMDSALEGWKSGDVKAEVDALPDGSYEAVLYDEVRAPTRPHVWNRGAVGSARLQRGGLLLHMPPTTWGKLYPVTPARKVASIQWIPGRPPPGLVGRLRGAEPGTPVAFADPDSADAGPGDGGPADVATAYPRNVAILSDASTVSAAEAFVLRAMRNEKVTLFGQHTGSSIDYRTVGVVRFDCPDARLYVGYPTIVGSDRLPEGGVRPTGIVPDVHLDPGDPDPISRILEHCRGSR